MTNLTHKDQNGYALLLSVIVLGSVASILVTSVMLSGSTLLRTAGFVDDGEEAHALAEACAEEALLEIHDNTNYTGTGSLTYETGTCDFSVTKQQGKKYQIEVEGNAGLATRRILIEINSTSPVISITSWREVVLF